MSCAQITRLGANFKPSAINIEYLDDGDNRKYMQFPLAFAGFTDPEVLTDTLWTDYSSFFNKKSIPKQKLLKFIKNAIARAPSLDLTDQTKDTIDKFKQQMSHEFEKNVVRPGDPGFKYDVQEDFGPATEKSEWDD